MHNTPLYGGFERLDVLGIHVLSLFGVVPLLLWIIAWKGWALWLAARRREPVWFVALLVINTFGLLEIFYIFVIAKNTDTPDSVPSPALPAPGSGQ